MRASRPKAGLPAGRPGCVSRVGNLKEGRVTATLCRFQPIVQRTGGILLSQGLAPQVPSARTGLTSLFGMGRGISPSLWPPNCQRARFPSHEGVQRASGVVAVTARHLQNSIATQTCSKSRPRAISTGQLNALLRLHRPPINVVVFHGPYSLEVMGNLISRWASRLDAFSGYPIQTWLISSALGRTTDTPEVRSSRSSRTRDDSSQVPNAHGG